MPKRSDDMTAPQSAQGRKPRFTARGGRSPKHATALDDGCDVTAHCLECPLSECKYDNVKPYRIWLKRNDEVGRVKIDIPIRSQTIVDKSKVKRDERAAIDLKIIEAILFKQLNTTFVDISERLGVTVNRVREFKYALKYAEMPPRQTNPPK